MAQPSASAWDEIEAEYVHGPKSITQIGREYNVSKTAIRKRADKEGWQRQAPDAKLVAQTKRNLLAGQRLRADREAAAAARRMSTPEQIAEDEAEEDDDIRASVGRDAEFMERAASAAEKSLANVLAALEAVDIQIRGLREALDKATTDKERDEAIKAIFASGKVNKINSETLRLALDAYRCARGLDDDKESAPAPNTDQVLGALASLIPQIIEKHQRRRVVVTSPAVEIEAPPAEPAAAVVVGSAP